MATTRLMTAQDLEDMGSEAERYELIEGILRERVPMGARHGEIEFEIGGPLHRHVRGAGLGRVYPSDTHFVILVDPDITVVPDLSFVRADRLPPEEERQGFLRLAPDLVVEVVSPTDRFNAVMEKVDQYQRAGVPLIWLVQPRRRAVTEFALGQEPRTLREGDALDGGEIVPGFVLPVADIFR
jgi:Uma2 family endonuclease